MKQQKNGRVPVKIEIIVYPEFFVELNRMAMTEGLSARRWIAEKLAELFEHPKDKVLPPYHGLGRRRKGLPQ